ncbi:MAG: efflux RND transporter periplasmic adaptor subunit [Calditrichia bacterium]
MKKFILIGIAVIVVAVLVIFNISKGDKSIEVQTEKVFRGSITQTVTGNGKIYPVTEVNISANVAGEILAINAEEGDSVKVGQVLVRLNDQQYQASVERQNSNILGAEASVTLAKNGLNRAQELAQKNLISEADLENAQAEYERAISTLQQAQAGLKEAQDALNKTVIRSPMNGIVIRKNKEVGEIALGSQFQEDVILVIGDLSKMEARAEVNENDIINVALGDTAYVEIDAFPDTTFLGKVTEISHSATTKGAGTMEEVTNYEVKILLLNKVPSFRPGMSSTSDIATATHKNVLNLPIQSLTARERRQLERKNVVESTPAEREREETIAANPRKLKDKENELVEVAFLVKDGTAQMRPVKVGISNDNYYEVLEGLQEGDEVITGPFKVLSRTLKEGDLVKIKNTQDNFLSSKEE